MPAKKNGAARAKGARWTAEDARCALARQAASGLSVWEFARREGVDPQKLYWWRQRLLPRPVTAQPAFVEISAPAPVEQRIEVVLLSGHILRFSATLAPEALRGFVDALDRVAAC
jgi:hypothetical protein